MNKQTNHCPLAETVSSDVKTTLRPYFLRATCNIFLFGHAAIPETFARNTRIRLLAF